MKQLLKAKLFKAVKKGSIDDVSKVVAAGLDINERDLSGETALLRAVSLAFSAHFLRALLDAGANATTRQGETALIIAAAKGNAEVISLVIGAGIAFPQT